VTTTASDTLSAIETVRELIAAGVLTPEALGVPARAETSSLVPGEPIRLGALIAKAQAGMNENTLRTYRTYMTVLLDGWPATAPAEEKLYPGLGDVWAHEVLTSDLEEALLWVERRALLSASWRAQRRRSVQRVARTTDGSGAKYNAVGAWRKVFSVAVRDRHLAKGFDPSQEVAKPRRSNGRRRPLEDGHMAEFWAFVTGTGNDPELDTMMCQTILISGARREGLLNLELAGIDLDECTIRLDEKFGKVVEQPVPDWFVRELHAFATSRGAYDPTDKVFRYRATPKKPSHAITSRRFDYIFDRLQASYPWADQRQVTAHVLRHHAVALIERNSSKAVALRFARHEPEDTNDRYGQASDREIAQAVTSVHGGSHPWARD
jgi:site-specific recombinase XerC